MNRTESSGKGKGSTVNILVNASWCQSWLNSDLDYLIIKYQPFYLPWDFIPWDFTSIILLEVYITSQANAKKELDDLYSIDNSLEMVNSDGLFIITSDFNQAK